MILVSGNQSGDLDSLVSAYVKSEIIRIKSQSVEEVLALFCFPRRLWALRAEAIRLFQKYDVNLDHILFIDDLESLDLKRYAAENQLKIILVDHNSPESELEAYSNCIVEIIDHHKISHKLINIKYLIAGTVSGATL